MGKRSSYAPRGVGWGLGVARVGRAMGAVIQSPRNGAEQ